MQVQLHFGINSDSRKRRPSPLLYPHPVTNLTTMADILVYLPGTKQLDLRLTILAVLQKGQLMGFSAKNFDSIFRLIIVTHFQAFSGLLSVGLTPDDIFQNVLIVIKSYNVASQLQQGLSKFSWKPSQNFTEFATLLYTLVTCCVQENTHPNVSTGKQGIWGG